MKVGDVVYSTKVRPYEKATIVKVDVTVKNRENKKEVRSKYVAKYLDGSELTFYGFNLNKSIFKHIVQDGQMSIFDYIAN